MLALVTLIPGIGPVLAGLLGGAGAVFGQIGSAVAGTARAIASNPVLLAVVGTILAAALFVWQHEQIVRLKASQLDPASGFTWQAEAKDNAAAVAIYAPSLRTLIDATNRETASLNALSAAGKVKLAAASAIGRAYASTVPESAKHSAAIVAADQGATACDRAQAVDKAFLETLP